MLNKIKFTVKPLGLITKSKWHNQKLKAFKISLEYNNLKHTYDFYQGLGIEHNPTIESVLHSLLLDARCAESSYDDFINEFNYDDNNQSKAIYKACRITINKLNYMFNDEEQAELNELLKDY